MIKSLECFETFKNRILDAVLYWSSEWLTHSISRQFAHAGSTSDDPDTLALDRALFDTRQIYPFETFHTPCFGDDDLNLQHAAHSSVNTRLELVDNAEEVRPEDDDVECIPADEESTTTLWMSCSPGRDSPDQEEEDEDDDEDEDDSLPLSCFQTSKSVNKQSTEVTKSKKVGKTAKKQKKKEKDRDAPKKPMSAYSLFFRDTQSSIKSQNPQASFGDISRIVASMWDSLDTHDKDKYNGQAEQAKQMYIKTLEEYKAGKKTSTQQKISSAKTKSNQKSKQTLDMDSDDEKPVKTKSTRKPDISSDEEFVIVEKKRRPPMKHMSDSEQSSSEDEVKKSVAPRCSRADCNNIAVNDVRWDFDFCSVDCVVSHCKDIFTAWVASRTVKVE